jgi:hypothetical protein
MRILRTLKFLYKCEREECNAEFYKVWNRGEKKVSPIKCLGCGEVTARNKPFDVGKELDK